MLKYLFWFLLHFGFGPSFHPKFFLLHNLVSKPLQSVFHLILSLHYKWYKWDMILHPFYLISLHNLEYNLNKKYVYNLRFFIFWLIIEFYYLPWIVKWKWTNWTSNSYFNFLWHVLIQLQWTFIGQIYLFKWCSKEDWYQIKTYNLNWR